MIVIPRTIPLFQAIIFIYKYCLTRKKVQLQTMRRLGALIKQSAHAYIQKPNCSCMDHVIEAVDAFTKYDRETTRGNTTGKRVQ